MKPYIICHMMTSLDGRIDCDMVGKLQGVDEYYESLQTLGVCATLSGRVTAELELALKGKFEPKNGDKFGKTGFSKKSSRKNYEVVTDTKGVLLWDDDAKYDKHHIIVLSEEVSKEYLDYLDGKNISWIVCGAQKINIDKACEILADEFDVKRLAVVGGPIINSAFLSAGLIDEVSILIGLGIDGRTGFPAIFDDFPKENEPVLLELKSALTYKNGAVWLRYSVKK